jgi:hypothetical protein
MTAREHPFAIIIQDKRYPDKHGTMALTAVALTPDRAALAAHNAELSTGPWHTSITLQRN